MQILRLLVESYISACFADSGPPLEHRLADLVVIIHVSRLWSTLSPLHHILSVLCYNFITGLKQIHVGQVAGRSWLRNQHLSVGETLRIFSSLIILGSLALAFGKLHGGKARRFRLDDDDAILIDIAIAADSLVVGLHGESDALLGAWATCELHPPICQAFNRVTNDDICLIEWHIFGGGCCTIVLHLLLEQPLAERTHVAVPLALSDLYAHVPAFLFAAAGFSELHPSFG